MVCSAGASCVTGEARYGASPAAGGVQVTPMCACAPLWSGDKNSYRHIQELLSNTKQGLLIA